MSIIQAQEVFDFEGYRREIAALDQSAQKWADSLVNYVNRVKNSLDETKGELREIANALRTGSSTKSFEDNARQIDILAQRAANYRKQLDDVSQAEKANQTLIQDLTAKLEQLNARYQALNPSAKDYAKQQRAILQETKVVTKAIEVQNGVLKEGKRVVDAAEGSFDALKKQTRDLKKQLDGMPDAYDKTTGKINEQNRAAVELNKTYQKNISLIKQVEASQQIHNRNVGNYPKSTSGDTIGLPSVAGIAKNVIGAGAAVAGVGSLFDAIGKVGSVTADFEKFDAVLTNTFQSSKAASEAMDMIQRFAAKTPDSVNELTESFVKLANRGFVPTAKEMRQLSDLAASTGKPFDQLVEAILDAQTGEFERLKEFGIKTKKSGDDISFSFKGQTTVVKNTEEALRGYILSLGDLKGVSGSTEKVAETLGGKVSNLGDAYDQLALKVGQKLAPLFGLVVSGATAALSKMTSLFKTTNDLAKDGLSAYEDQKRAVKDLQDNVAPLINRYEELSEKARKLGGESKLSKIEQIELQKAINGISEVIPSAISAQDQYGKVMSINTQVARDYITEQERVSRVLNADAIAKYNESLDLTKRRIQSLTEQLTLVQGATPTKPGEPAVSQPSNTRPGGATGIPLTGLSEEDRRSQIGRINGEIKKAEESAKDLEAVINRLSGKAPDRTPSAIPPSIKSSVAPPTDSARNKALQDAIMKAKAESDKKLSEATNDRQDGLLSEQDYIEKRLAITLSGIEERQALLEKAGKKETDDYKKLIKEKLDADTQYKRDQLKLDMASVKSDTEKNISKLDSRRSEGLIDEQAYVDEKHQITVDGINRQMQVLKEAGQMESKLYEDLTNDLLSEQSRYYDERLKAEVGSWKKQLTETKEGLKSISDEMAAGLDEQLTGIEARYRKRRNEIQQQMASGKTGKTEGQNLLHALTMDQLREELQATEDAYKKDKELYRSLIDDKITALELFKSDANRTPKEILEAEKQIMELRKALKDAEAEDDKKRNKDVAAIEKNTDDETNNHKIKNIEKVKEKRKALWDMALQLAGTVGSAVSDITSAYLSRDEARLEKQKENELRLAGDSVEQKQRIEEQYAKRKAELQRKQAIADRAAALFNIALSTAMGVASVLSTGGGTHYADLGISAGLLTAFVIATGAIQAAAVLAKPLPTYKTGKRDSDSYTGPALAGEAGAELWIQDGKARLLDRPTMISTKRGDTIYTASETSAILSGIYNQRARDRHFGNLNEINQSIQTLREGRITEMSISMTNGLSGLNEKSLAIAIGKEVGRAIDNRPVHETIIDEEGNFHNAVRKGISRHEYLNKRNSFK